MTPSESPAAILPDFDSPSVIANCPPALQSQLAVCAPHGLGATLRAALAGRTRSLRVVVGYFAHGERNPLDSPDHLIAQEIREGFGRVDRESSTLSLCFGQLTSPEASLAIRTWAALCQWFQGNKSEANSWVESFLARIAAEPGSASTWLGATLNGRTQDALQAWLSAGGTQWHDLLRNTAAGLQDGGIQAASRLAAFFAARQADIRCGQTIVGEYGLFHPKVYIVERDEAPAPDTVVVVGSGNWSSRAFSPGEHSGNVELGVAFRSPGHLWSDPARPPDPAVSARVTEAARALFAASDSAGVAQWDRVQPTLDFVQAATRWIQIGEPTGPAPTTAVPTLATTLADCTPLERAQLGLYRMISELIGTGSALHPSAVDYQPTAYQRQAAQRLVSILDQYDGGLLCDGVGLGKTYIATTVLVHYANLWRERTSTNTSIEGPFRVTVLAPASVVGTWRKEALPGLGAFGVDLAEVRVMSHGTLSKLVPKSAALQRRPGQALSDLEHLLLSDLVVVDEAHNFRAVSAQRTKVLRDLLRIQPHRTFARRVLLLTATPINNGIDDLKQQLSLFLSRPIHPVQTQAPLEYARAVHKRITDRAHEVRAAGSEAKDLIGLLIHGNSEHPFSDAIPFRDDLDLGPAIGSQLTQYLSQERDRLTALQEAIRTAGQGGGPDPKASERIAEDLLDRLVVQRSRVMCQTIERESGSAQLDFRSPATTADGLRYSDQYDGVSDVLAGLLPLFAADGTPRPHGPAPLGLDVYRWHAIRRGLPGADDASSLVGIQRILVLKRLESSVVTFLITLLRLTVLHAHRLNQLANLGRDSGQVAAETELRSALSAIVAELGPSDTQKLRTLVLGDNRSTSTGELVGELSRAHVEDRPESEDEEDVPQMILPLDEPSGEAPARVEFDRLWPLREALLRDFGTLLRVTPRLIDTVFGRFDPAAWPKRFLAGGRHVQWPTNSAAWGLRLITDAKVRKLIARAIEARRAGQKVIIFSQFTDTVCYLNSVLREAQSFHEDDWARVRRDGHELRELQATELAALWRSTAAVTGDTEDKSEVVDRFAPYYRIRPFRPVVPEAGATLEEIAAVDAWRASWRAAMAQPLDVVIATDVLAEGVNLQDVAVLINFDIHWNPVRMIQRAGRIDRRLNRKIEEAREFPDLLDLAAREGLQPPPYYWHAHRVEPPRIVNMLLPDDVEAQLLLRDRIAFKSLAIDFTLGLERSTGAEADWMKDYTYRGVAGLRGFERDRAIELLAGHQAGLLASFAKRGIQTAWAENLDAWLRVAGADPSGVILGRALVGQREAAGNILGRRRLVPYIHGGVPHWLWTDLRGGRAVLREWLVVDGRSRTPEVTPSLPAGTDAALPLRASHLLAAAQLLATSPSVDSLSCAHIDNALAQGVTALVAPKFGNSDERENLRITDYFLLQLPAPVEA